MKKLLLFVVTMLLTSCDLAPADDYVKPLDGEQCVILARGVQTVTLAEQLGAQESVARARVIKASGELNARELYWMNKMVDYSFNTSLEPDQRPIEFYKFCTGIKA